MAKSIPTKPRLVVTGKMRAQHFKNAAARVAAALTPDKPPATKLVRHVDIRVMTKVYEPKKPRRPRNSFHVVQLGLPRDADEFATFAATMAGVNPTGFRQPSAKPHNWSSTSLVEQAAIRAGHMTPPSFERSKRGERTLAADAAMKGRIEFERQHGVDPKYLNANARRMLAQQTLALAAE